MLRVLAEAMTALAATAGSAVVQAAGTDVWTTFRSRVAQLFGRGDDRQAEVALERLDQTASALGQADESQAVRVRTRQEASWQTRFEDLLEELPESEREEAAGQLRELVQLADRRSGAGVSAGNGGLAVSGSVSIHAEDGSAAAGVINGGVHLGTPRQPGPVQG